MEQILNIYLANNKSKSPNTSITFKQNIIRIEKILKLKVEEFDANSFNNINSIIDELINEYSLNTIILTISTIIFLMKHFKSNDEIINSMNDYMNELIDTRNNIDINQTATEKEIDNWINYNELKNKVQDLSTEYINNKISFTSFRNFLFLSLYTLMIPARISNYLNMKYITLNTKTPEQYDKKYNYIYKDGVYHFVYNNCKTAKTIGQVIVKVENENMNKLIDKWFQDYNFKKKEFLINIDGNSVNQTNVTHGLNSITKKLFNKSLSINNFRHSFLTLFLSDPKSIKEKQEIAKVMGQTYKISRMELYNRININ